MPLAIDASSPAIATSAGITATTSSFTPPANSKLLIGWSGNSDTGNPGSNPTITDNLGTHLTYTLGDFASHNDSPAASGMAATWVAEVGTSAAMTVSVTSPQNPNGSGTQVKVWVLTGADATTSYGAHGKVASTSQTNISQNYTAQRNGGWGFIVVNDWDATTAMSAGTGCTSDGSAINNGVTYAFMRRTTADDVSGNTNTLNVTRPASSTNIHWCYIEILPAESSDSPRLLPANPIRFPGLSFQPWQGYESAVSADVSVNAECATGIGAADNASVSIAVNAESATGTGTANDSGPSVASSAEPATGTGAADNASVAITVNAECATGTGTAGDGTPAIAVNAECATGTGTADDATVSTTSDVNASAECATGTGAADNLTISIAVNAECATGTGVADSATPAIGAAPTNATGTGAADNPSISLQINGGVAAGTGTASDPTPAIAVLGDQATGTGAALDPTVSTETITNAPAEVAAGTGVAGDISVALTINVEVAAGSGSAPDPAAQIAPNADVATGTGVANNATILTGSEPPAGIAAGVGSALDASIALLVYAECATGVGEVLQVSLVKPILPFYDMSGGTRSSGTDQGVLSGAGLSDMALAGTEVDPNSSGAGGVDAGPTRASGLF